jgi:hypothetical protein
VEGFGVSVGCETAAGESSAGGAGRAVGGDLRCEIKHSGAVCCAG